MFTAFPLGRHWVKTLCIAICSVAVAAGAGAQNFPSKAIKIVVPNAAGGAADITARTVGQKLSEALGQSVVIENNVTEFVLSKVKVTEKAISFDELMGQN